MVRYVWSDPFWNGKRKPYVIAVCMASLMLLLLFLANLSYLYGMLYKSNDRVQALNVLAVDFDQGVIGESLAAAYQATKGVSFPTLQFHNVSEYPTIESIREAVCSGRFWAAIFTHAGASDRLSAALTGGSAAASYNASNTITYIWNGARYAAVQLGDVSGNMETLIGRTSAIYHVVNGTTAISLLNTTSAQAVIAYSNPIVSSNINIMPTNQGGRVLYNTVTMVFPIIQQFFFLMAINGISNGFKVYGHMQTSAIGLTRLVLSLVYTILASLCTAGYIWAFKEDWGLNVGQFFLTWMAFWLYGHINFNIMDAVTAFIPVSFLSFFVLTWIVLNVTSTIYPFELGAGFYRWGYALPAHEVYSLLVTIWSGGCDNQLRISLPVLFAWEVVSLILAVLGTNFRNNEAYRERIEEETHNTIVSGKGGTVQVMQVEESTDLAHFPMPFQDALMPRRNGLRRMDTV